MPSVNNSSTITTDANDGVERATFNCSTNTLRGDHESAQGQHMRQVVPYLPVNEDPASIDIPIRGKAVFTYAIIFLWIGYFVAVMTSAEFRFLPIKVNWMVGPSSAVLIKTGGITVKKVLGEGQWWRLVTAELSHAGIFHLGTNAVTIHYLGHLLEPDWGPVKMALIFTVSAISASIASLAWASERVVAVGGSGGVFGVLSATFVFILEFAYQIPKPWYALLAAICIWTFSVGLSFAPGVDWKAHIGGAVAGALTALMLIYDIPSLTHREALADIEIMKQFAATKSRTVRHSDSPESGRVAFYRMKLAKGVDNTCFLSPLCTDGRGDIVLADLPAMKRPAIVARLNPSAKRFSMRRHKLVAHPVGLAVINHCINWRSGWIWALRIASLFLIIGLNGTLLWKGSLQNHRPEISVSIDLLPELDSGERRLQGSYGCETSLSTGCDNFLYKLKKN